ncbi:MAG: ankyrin repeat domain-containing protein [Dehalococcoidia bacterium]
MPFFRRGADNSLAKELTALAERQAAGELMRIDLVTIQAQLAANPRLARNGRPILAAIRLRSLPLVRMLVQAGADTGIKVAQKRSLLHLAAEGGHPEIVRLLVERGLAVNARDRYRRTPLMVAAGEGQTDAALTLLELGADLDIRDLIGGRATDWAAFWRHFDLARALLVATGRDGAPAWGTSDVELAVLAREDEHAHRLARERLAGGAGSGRL